MQLNGGNSYQHLIDKKTNKKLKHQLDAQVEEHSFKDINMKFKGENQIGAISMIWESFTQNQS